VYVLGILEVLEQCWYEKRVNSPAKGDMVFFARKKKAIKGDDENTK
jgi:hypothetical protein